MTLRAVDELASQVDDPREPTNSNLRHAAYPPLQTADRAAALAHPAVVRCSSTLP
jgi:hypothetical protein